MERDARRAAGLPGVEPGAEDEDDDSDSEEILDLVPEVPAALTVVFLKPLPSVSCCSSAAACMTARNVVWDRCGRMRDLLATCGAASILTAPLLPKSKTSLACRQQWSRSQSTIERWYC
jgi:hypothetical protein